MRILFLIVLMVCGVSFAQVTPVNLTKTVTTAGTQIQVSTGNQKPSSIYFEALGSNTGFIYVGLSNVSSTVYIARLSAGQGFAVSTDTTAGRGADLKLSDYWVDSSVNGEAVQVTYMYRTGP